MLLTETISYLHNKMMRKFWNICTSVSLTLLMSLTFTACGDDDDEPSGGNSGAATEQPDHHPSDDDQSPLPSENIFARGADVSWLTQIEEDGFTFYNKSGETADVLNILRYECGVNAVRLRVWVDPENKWNDVEDIVVKARLCASLGMRMMIDFHLSDTWADPSNQSVPASWASVSPGQDMADKVHEHVRSILYRLKTEGITPEWVQIGNEISSGMLWESGRVKGNDPGEFVKYFNAGATAARTVFPQIKVVLHLNNGFDSDLYTWFLNLMKKHNADYDIIGMSLYPEAESGEGDTWEVKTDQGMIKHCKSNICSVYSSYGKPVIISEIGFHHSNGVSANEVIRSFISDFKDGGILQGIFYWEPEAPEGFQGYHKGAFEKGRPNEALKAFID